jgi:hypothetical protein
MFGERTNRIGGEARYGSFSAQTVVHGHDNHSLPGRRRCRRRLLFLVLSLVHALGWMIRVLYGARLIKSAKLSYHSFRKIRINILYT